MSLKEKLQSGYEFIKANQYLEARQIYDQVIRELPDQPIGYIGQAWCLMIRPGPCPFSELEKQILRARGRTCAPEYQDELRRLVNLRGTDIEATLLMYMSLGCCWEAAKLLVDMGTDIDAKTNTNATALWFICRTELRTEDKEAGRKIAKLLLDMGASVDVTNTGGVALFNARTDPEISAMIRAVHPEQKWGGAPASKVPQPVEKQVSMAWVFGIGGAAIGLVLGTVLDQFFAGFLWAAVLAILGGLIGYQIDKIREEGIAAVGKAIRNLVIILAALAVFGLLFAKCAIPEQKEYGTCPNCHTRIEKKYIRNDGYCARCD